MQDITPFYRWEKFYQSTQDPKSPFYEKEYNYQQYTHDIYGYYIHPDWDEIGSETLYIKLLYVNYDKRIAIIECFGEWNDAINNDIMLLKREVLDILLGYGVVYFILLGENVFNFHGSDDAYYEEWFEEVGEGWIACIQFRDFIHHEWKKFHLDGYIHYGGTIELEHWRTMHPLVFAEQVHRSVAYRLGE